MKNIFYKSSDHYTNTIDPLNSYISQLTTFYRLKYDLSKEEANKKIQELIKSNFKNKIIKYFERQDNGDRKVKESYVLDYINETIKNNQILTPTFTTYLSKTEKRSLLSDFIANNVKKRSIAKKISQKAKIEGNTLLHVSKDNEQNMIKLYNNSLSGAFAQEACILYNPTSHSTLTSVTRTVSSFANTSNESILYGNKYLPTIDDVLNYITYVVTFCNKEAIQKVKNKYNLYVPTTNDIVNIFRRSTDLYFSSLNLYEQHIIPLLNKLDEEERIALAYINDLYHLSIYNEKLIRTFLEEISKKVIKNEINKEYIEKIKEIDENVLNLAHSIFFYEIQGYGKDYEKMNDIGLTSNLYFTSLNILSTLNKYSDFIETFFLSNILPFNSARIKYMRRRAVVLSDTDSTCFTLDKWIEWYRGKFVIDSDSIAISSSIAFLATQVIVHLLASLSANLNVSKEDLRILAMKNEFLWTVHVPAEVSKHYFAYTVMQEGNVFKKPDIEIKGVHLKNSALPRTVIEDGKDLIKYILTTIHNNEKISLTKVINRIKELENTIYSQIKSGNNEYFKRSKIKNKEAYALNEDLSPFARHNFYVEIFSEKYGKINEPPYDVYIIPTILDNRKKLTDWLDSIKDLGIKNKLSNWLEKNKKTNLPTIYLETTLLETKGIFEEFENIIDYKRIILNVTKQHRIILECLGVIFNEELLIGESFIN